VKRLFWRWFYDLAEVVAADPPSAANYNVATEEKNPDSIFNTYRRLLALRHSEPALRGGTYQAINEDDPNVFA
jgi:glycosidase